MRIFFYIISIICPSLRENTTDRKYGTIAKNILKIINHYVKWSVHAVEQKYCQIRS
jgi:hypothetical protein